MSDPGSVIGCIFLTLVTFKGEKVKNIGFHLDFKWNLIHIKGERWAYRQVISILILILVKTEFTGFFLWW